MIVTIRQSMFFKNYKSYVTCDRPERSLQFKSIIIPIKWSRCRERERFLKLGSPNGYWLISRKPNIDGHSKIPSVFVSDTDTPGTLLHTCSQCVGRKKRNFFNSKYSFDFKYVFTDFDNCY